MYSLLQMWLSKLFFLILLENKKKNNRKKYESDVNCDNFMNIFWTDVSQLMLKEHIINDHIATSKFLVDGNLYWHVWKSVNVP